MRRLRIVCVVMALVFAGFTVALKLSVATSVHAQQQAVAPDSSVHVSAMLRSLPLQLPAMTASGSATQIVSSATQDPSAQIQAGAVQVATQATAATNTPVTIAKNVSVRGLAVEPQSPNASRAQSGETSAWPALVYLTNADKGNRIFTLATALSASGVLPTAKMTLFAGQAAAGSLGDGGAASAAEFDLKLDSTVMRSGVAVAQDGTIFVSDTLNATIRSIAGAASSEPGIVRSVVGRFGSRQNFELVEPLGLALDRPGNLYIADRGANAVLMLHSASSDSPGVLEILGHVVSPASVGVTLDGSKVFAASPDTGAIVQINTKTRSISSMGISSSMFTMPTGHGEILNKAVPAGLAVDGAGNLFISFSGVGNSLGQIERIDAASGKIKTVALNLSSPGEIAFDSNGNLFIADQGTRRLLELRGAGVPANTVSLTPPANQVPYGPEPVAGTSPTQTFTLTNNSTGTITQVSSAFQGIDPGDFTVASTSCSGTLLADMSCSFNVAFVPEAAGSRSASLAVNYTAAGTQNTLTAPMTGIGDDYQITLASGAMQQITIAQGLSATFLLQLVPDDTFGGAVTLLCPGNLPAATSCGISAGTSVTTPLVPTLVANVTPGTAVPFNVTFQTTSGVVVKPAGADAGSIIFAPSGGLSGPVNSARNFPRRPLPALFGASAILLAVLFAPLFSRPNRRDGSAQDAVFEDPRDNFVFGSRLRGTLCICALVAFFAAALGGCHHSSTTGIVITPKGTFNLTVQATAQNATRGFVVTMVVD